jgi:hypothetical protein
MPTIKIDQNLEADDRRLIDLAHQLKPEHRAIVVKIEQDLLMCGGRHPSSGFSTRMPLVSNCPLDG